MTNYKDNNAKIKSKNGNERNKGRRRKTGGRFALLQKKGA